MPAPTQRTLRPLTLDQLRRYAVARSLFAPTTLVKAVQRLGGFLQADPLRAPARAQDLTLRHRVKAYRAGDLERRYPQLPLQEDFFINYGFLTPELRALMHPRTARRVWDRARWKLAEAVLEQVRVLGEAHPDEVDAALNHGKVKNWFGGNSRLSTELLDGLHYRGHLDVVRRDSGTRCYALAAPWGPPPDPDVALDAMVDALVQKYAPLTASGLSRLVSMLVSGAPQWETRRRMAFQRAKARLPNARVDGVDWFWPEGESPARATQAAERVCLLAPFDPVVWDRPRFEHLWGWAYRFEAYTPAAKRVRGHYALPLLWRDQVIGWGNLKVAEGRLQHDLGFVDKRPRDAAFKQALEAELAAMESFLGL